MSLYVSRMVGTKKLWICWRFILRPQVGQALKCRLFQVWDLGASVTTCTDPFGHPWLKNTTTFCSGVWNTHLSTLSCAFFGCLMFDDFSDLDCWRLFFVWQAVCCYHDPGRNEVQGAKAIQAENFQTWGKFNPTTILMISLKEPNLFDS